MWGSHVSLGFFHVYDLKSVPVSKVKRGSSHYLILLFDTVCLVEVQMFLGSLTHLGGLRELVWISRQEAGLGNEESDVVRRKLPKSTQRSHIAEVHTQLSPGGFMWGWWETLHVRIRGGALEK